MAGLDVKKLKDKATVKKELPKAVELDPAWCTLTTEMFSLQDEFEAAVGPLQKKILAHSRKLYTRSDKVLKELKKDKKGNKYEIERVLLVRKFAYTIGTVMKGSMMPY
ncbi:MAG: hypothetical protein AB8B60_15700 [Sulfitobacter sp.]